MNKGWLRTTKGLHYYILWLCSVKSGIIFNKLDVCCLSSTIKYLCFQLKKLHQHVITLLKEVCLEIPKCCCCCCCCCGHHVNNYTAKFPVIIHFDSLGTDYLMQVLIIQLFVPSKSWYASGAAKLTLTGWTYKSWTGTVCVFFTLQWTLMILPCCKSLWQSSDSRAW